MVMQKQPLAEILRPHSLEGYIGQEHLMGEGAVLRTAIESGNIQSMIFWGPPGVGKTTLALLIAQSIDAEFFTLSAISSGVKDIREVIDKAKKSERRCILFIDEIHRFSKSQQDSLLGAVEQGVVTLIGATTENPSFEVISPLLSRCQVYVLRELSKENLEQLLQTAIHYLEGQMNCKIRLENTEALLRISGGDARKLLNAIELVTWMTPPADGVITLTREQVIHVIQQNLALYDKKGEEHYNIISALHKSMRNSDPDAAVYWLARMLEAGEDPLYVARRVIRFASEDVGIADPRALQLAVSAYDACHYIGMPECTDALAEAVIYMSVAPKSNAVDVAYAMARQDALQMLDEPVPLVIRNAPTKLMKDLGYGDGYQYAHDTEDKLTNMQCLPDSLKDKEYYRPTKQGLERQVAERLNSIKEWKKQHQ